TVLKRHNTTLKDTINVFKRQETALRHQIEVTQKDAADKEVRMVELSSRLGALNRELQAADMSYSGVLRRMEEARLSADEKTTAVKVARLATPPMMPIYPRPRRSASAGLMFGGFLGLLLAFAKDWLEDHVTSTEDVEEGLGLRALGIFNRERVTERAELAAAVLNNEFLAFTEAVAGLRTNIVMGGTGETAIKSVLISSAGVECGKTITACNLALMFALTGERTLIVDFDFRRPRIGRLLTTTGDKTKSLAHALLEGVCDDGCFGALVQKGPHANLDVIASAADRHLRPAHLLGHASIKQFIDWAHAHYDRVIIDSPPHGVLSDAVNLAALASGVIIVCRHNKSRKHGIARTIQSMEHVNANLLGAVINGVPKGMFCSYDYYRGGYDIKDYHVATGDDDGEAVGR
ncbi:MAG: AAA family ATPase, partial [Verrucomicrobia bacterium]|nr:AAA family ATPase [Verrucomicrobiota bacterium]